MYNSLVEAFRAAQAASAEAFARVGVLASQVGADSAIVPLPVDHAGEYRRFLRRLVASLIDRAGNEFGIAGAPVSIDETRIPVGGYPNIWEALRAGETPDLDRYWRVLTQRYEHRGQRAGVPSGRPDAGRSVGAGCTERGAPVCHGRAPAPQCAVRAVCRAPVAASNGRRACRSAGGLVGVVSLCAGCRRAGVGRLPAPVRSRRTVCAPTAADVPGSRCRAIQRVLGAAVHSFAWRAPPGVRRPAPIRASIRVNLGVSSLAPLLCPVSTGHFLFWNPYDSLVRALAGHR